VGETRHDDVPVFIKLSPLDRRFELMISNVSGQANAGKTTTKGMPAVSACAERSESKEASAAARRRPE
jgi:hypothetical protein